jgi:two-component system response regulator AtoC
MMDIFDTVKKVSEYKTTVLLMGESGTGKELVARALHFNSSRADKPFITVNCGAIPENLLESELFGHVKGSFTGAHRSKKGLFEEADQGTLFLDEIGELPLLLQVKLLRALQEEEIRKIGDNAPVKVDVRIIAATVKDLSAQVESGNFREDLFYRLNVLPIYIPPLRERKEDIPLLVNYFIDKYNKKLKLRIKNVTNEALKVLMDSEWQGNVRELENTVERAMVLTNDGKIGIENLPTSLRGVGVKSKFKVSKDELSIKKMTRVLEVDLIIKALDKAAGNRTTAAKMLEISHRALLYKIKEYKLDKKSKESQ